MRVVGGVARVEDVDAFVADLDGVGDEYDCAVQAFDADYVADRAHLERAVERANRAFERGENVASERSVEILLYAAGRRQIRRALAMGVDAGEHEVVVVVDGGDETGAAEAVGDLLVERRSVLGETGDAVAGETDDAVAGDPATLREFFDVGDAELAAADGDLAGIVGERVALLDVEK